jgi:hypothetical protein
MASLSVMDTGFAIIPFLLVILIETTVVIAAPRLVPDVLDIAILAEQFAKGLGTKRREFLNDEELRDVLGFHLFIRECELGTLSQLASDDLDSEFDNIRTSIHTKVSLDEDIFSEHVKELAAMANALGRLFTTTLITLVSLLAIVIDRWFGFALSPIIVFGPVALAFVGISIAYWWWRRNIESVQDYAIYRERHLIPPVTIFIILLNLLSVALILLIDGCIGPIDISILPARSICRVFA